MNLLLRDSDYLSAKNRILDLFGADKILIDSVNPRSYLKGKDEKKSHLL